VPGYLCIHVLLKFIVRFGLATFAVYRLALAALVVWLLV
jgi:undecaprenyl-diphosphatase